MPAQLQIKNAFKQYGPRVIFDDVNASFSTDQKIGVIGRNGAGKSTLCKMITGQEEMDQGNLCKSSDLRLSYLEQHDAFDPQETVLGFLTRYTQKEEWECAKMASRFHLKHTSLNLPIGNLPGGYQTRVKLAAMLLPEPNFLILDEPTNYLDLNTLILLENFLLNFDGGFLIVSHDREFLKRTCTHTLEAENGNLVFYPGNVEDYLMFKSDQKNQIVSYNKTVETKKKQLQNFVDRFKANASKAGLAQSKMKLIEKLQTIEVGRSAGHVRIRIPPVDQRHGVALKCHDLAIGYPEKLVADSINFDIDRGSRVAVLGENGQGKTTFLRTLANDLSPKSGEYRWGNHSKIAYYAQHVLSMLDSEDTVYHHLKKMGAEGVTHQDLLDLAGSFLFKGDEVEKKVAVLSGGERARLCLAGLLVSKSNILLLDEPTNHLDFETVEALGNALHKYHGTVFFISHDRTFVHLVATQILDVKRGKIVRYPGKYDEYVYALEKNARQEFNEEEEEDQEQDASKEIKPISEISKSSSLPQEGKIESQPSLTYLERKSIKAEIKKLEKRLQGIEENLNGHRNEKESILKQFAENPSSWTRKLNDHLVIVGKLIEEQETIWLNLQEKFEKLKNVLGNEKG
ncbi:MAG: ABC-F family ATP-binding cassette domain-containing protein [Chlamydiae bacterium]|nr:ABC-F family ATP-binding cassette domain-containing protein [Chlamydiota bacterium]MBI3277134.1 ABC-F family ATP-binding cassette domain-containing protein [Chlamydiota bacterium]